MEKMTYLEHAAKHDLRVKARRIAERERRSYDRMPRHLATSARKHAPEIARAMAELAAQS